MSVTKALEIVRDSLVVKVLVIGILVLVLMVPLNMVRSMIREREITQQQVVAEIGSKWGGPQVVAGPVLSIPFKQAAKDSQGKKSFRTGFLHVLPEKLDVACEAVPEIRYRSLYEAVLYKARTALKGEFVLPDLSEFDLGPKDLQWDRAFVALGLSEVKGIRENVSAQLGGIEVVARQGMDNTEVLTSGISFQVPHEKEKGYAGKGPLSFRFSLQFDGSERLAFVPAGKETTVEMKSAWASPSFDGDFLPNERQISGAGFTANWKILYLNRFFPQYWTGNTYRIEDLTFGARFMIPADSYQKATRSAKYAIMFIGLTFLIFFIAESARKIRIHPLQYLLVGFALIVFYTLLVSISEHLDFVRAYIIASAATIVLISGYAGSVLRKGSLALLVGLLLIALYAYLYVLLQMEDFSLLFGSCGLFLVLAVMMYITRGINRPPAPPPLPQA